jgi:hypothetical protein
MAQSMKELFERVVMGARTRQAPSARNRRIADEVQVCGRTQADVAAEYHLSQRRVSQICQQVERWYYATRPWERGDACGSVESETDQELQRRQLTEVYRQAMRAHARSQQPLKTRRNRQSAGQVQWSEETEREQRDDTASLRVAMRVLEQRAKLRGRDEPSMGYTDHQRVKYLAWIVDALSSFRRDAEREGLVQSGAENSSALVERIVRELLGGGSAACKAAEREGEAPAGEAAAPVWEGEALDVSERAEPPTALDKPAAAPSSRTSDATGVEAHCDEPAEALDIGPSDDTIASCDRGAVEASSTDAQRKNVCRSGARRRPTELVEVLQERALAALGKAYGVGLDRASADEELDEFVNYADGTHPRWHYSPVQRAALLEWRRVRHLRGPYATLTNGPLTNGPLTNGPLTNGPVAHSN